ncbi:MAG: lysozyme inhibitor LprI family protein [Cyanobacteria bacterium P01_A01_bin.114]
MTSSLKPGWQAIIVTGIGAMATLWVTTLRAKADEIPGVAKPACPDRGQQSLNDCAVRWYQVTEYLNQLTYEASAATLSEPQQLDLYQIAQTWRRYRSLHCELTSEPFETASAYPMVFYNCMAQVTNDRIANLQGWGTSDLTYEDSEAELNSLMRDLQQYELQTLWRRYRDAHCAFVRESGSESGSDDLFDPCRSRLNQERLAQLDTYLTLR